MKSAKFLPSFKKNVTDCFKKKLNSVAFFCFKLKNMPKKKIEKTQLLQTFSENGNVTKTAQLLGVTTALFYYHQRTDGNFRREVLRIQQAKLAEKIEQI